MNEDRRPASGEPAADPSPPAAEASAAGAPPTGAGAADGGGGGPAPEGSGPAAGSGDDGAGPSPAEGSAADREAGGEPPGPEAEDERGEGASEGSAEAEEAADAVESLRVRLDEALDEANRERDAALRARAELENVRRRAERDVERAHRFGVEGLVAALLPVRDSLELGLRAAGEEGSTVEAIAEGTALTLRELGAAFEKFGAVEVDPAGEDFDPRFHEAMTMQEAEGVEPGKVLQVFQKGCVLHGRVVRPAKVIVSR